MKYFIKDGQVYAMPSSHYDNSDLYNLGDEEVQTILNPVSKVMQEERIWRDAELQRADVELFKVQDGEGTGLVSDWRAYRCALRAYPEQADFPNGVRPTFVNTDKE